MGFGVKGLEVRVMVTTEISQRMYVTLNAERQGEGAYFSVLFHSSLPRCQKIV